ncbi:NAD-binding Rossmann fold oxidoreductase [Leucogyrophana mollusca]|uniref:NAD-binding Rossmann fold oxidoreductase n=1 Tax=Leucogyrophana mollusca TaxID=85980 RepID=A0ACB8BD99_9AGAM|nr:NAD-binding Rossmann fold oxidoreductase [Leucogyrophana mollusca]
MSPLLTPLKVGIVGLSTSPSGWAHTFLAPALQHPTLAQIYSIVAVSTTSDTSSKASAQEQSEKLGHLVRAYSGDTSRIARDPDIDLVLVSVKAPHHKAAALPIINAGKDCFIEWPAGRNLAETEELAKAARYRGIRSMVGLQGRQSTVLLKAKELIAAGKIGRVLSCNVIALLPREVGMYGPLVRECHAYMLDSSSGASMLDIIVGHHLDALTFVLGSDFSSVSATTSTMYPSATLFDENGRPTGEIATVACPDHIAFTGLLSNGAIASASFRAGYASHARKHLIWEIDGESGVIRIESDSLTAISLMINDPQLFLDGAEVQVAGNDAPTGDAIDGKPVLSVDDLMTDISNVAMRNLVRQFGEFAKGAEGKYATLDDAVKIRRLLEAISVSARDGRRIDLQ